MILYRIIQIDFENVIWHLFTSFFDTKSEQREKYGHTLQTHFGSNIITMQSR